MKLTLLISALAAVVVFVLTYWYNYQSLLSKQPKNGVLPTDFTSFPPSSAWIIALPWAIAAFVVIFIIVYFVRKSGM
jgi:hypothetical protein